MTIFSRQALMFAVSGVLALMGSVALLPQPALAYLGDCSVCQDRQCYFEGYQDYCTYYGCGVPWEGFCTCEDGRWSCNPDAPPCGWDFASIASEPRLTVQAPGLASISSEIASTAAETGFFRRGD
jgi:hypothetical protein